MLYFYPRPKKADSGQQKSAAHNNQQKNDISNALRMEQVGVLQLYMCVHVFITFFLFIYLGQCKGRSSSENINQESIIRFFGNWNGSFFIAPSVTFLVVEYGVGVDFSTVGNSYSDCRNFLYIGIFMSLKSSIPIVKHQ